MPTDRIRVVSEAADPAFRKLDDPKPTPRLRELGLDGSERTVVYVGGFSPHKNLELLVKIFSRLAARPAFAYFFCVEGQGAPQGAQEPAKSSGETARADDGLARWSAITAASPAISTTA